MSATAGRSSPQGDLEAIRRQLHHASADLYRQLALYQQVLRSVLPRCVDQACFHLVTQVHPNRYRALAPPRRALLHRRIVALVSRCSSLLTVEQLIHLADQMGEERRRGGRERHGELLARLGAVLPEAEGMAPPAGVAPPPSPSPPPAGSVQLGFQPPLSGEWLGWGEGLAQGASAQAEAARHPWEAIGPQDRNGQDDQDPHDPFDPLDDQDDADGLAEPGDSAASADPRSAAGYPLDRAVAEVLGEGLPLPDFAALMASLRGGEEEEASPPPDPAAPPQARTLFSPPVGGGLLPTDPIALLAWLEGYEQALGRRLRNLSHALNGELLRAGLSSILLPVTLLDAVLAGQVESQGGPANILRLQLPMALAPAQGPLQAQVILLRCEDLELEQPQLRTVRRRLQQRRQEIRRMAHTYHRLQRRLQAREAEALWQQDMRTLRSQPEGPLPPL